MSVVRNLLRSILPAIIAVAPGPALAAPCEPTSIDTVSFQLVKNRNFIETRINDVPVSLMMDTGDAITTVTQELVDDFNLPRDAHHYTRTVGIGGRNLAVPNARLTDFRLGKYSTGPISIPVIEADLGPVPAYKGMVGADVLFKTDVEFDFPNKQLTFFGTTKCSKSWRPTGSRYMPVASKRSPESGRLMIPVVINGQRLWGVLDTGATNTLIMRSAALAAGLPQNTLSGPSAGWSRDAAGVAVAQQLVRFESVSIGPEHFSNIALRVADARFGEADLLIGMDFLKNRKIWISAATGRSFVMPASRPPALRTSEAVEGAPVKR